MASDREKLENETLGQLADRMQDGPNTPRHYYSALAELEPRKALWQKEAAKAQEAAASYTKENARYMFWSVVGIFVAAAISALFSFLSWRYPHLPH